jgi:hypothetical protein
MIQVLRTRASPPGACHRKVYHKSLSILVLLGGRRLFGFRGLQEQLSYFFGMLGRHSQDSGEDSCLMPAAKMI